MAETSQESETYLLQGAFESYRKTFVSLSPAGRLAPYNHLPVRNTIPLELATFQEFIRDHAQGLANEINHLRYHNHQLRAWDAVLPMYDDHDQLTLLLEFVSPIATVATNLPYAIRARFVFSASHICHQANLLTNPNWSETELPEDSHINYKVLKRVAEGWSAFYELSAAMKEISSQSFEGKTAEFRSKFNHRHPPRFVLGHTEVVRRVFGDQGQPSYIFGVTGPISLSSLVPLLEEQHAASLAAFDAYSKLITEQIVEIYD